VLVASVVQCYWRTNKRLQLIHFVFNLSQIAIAVTAARFSYYLLIGSLLARRQPLAMLVASGVYFLLNVIPVAIAISLTDGTPIRKTWREHYFWSFPYYLVGAAIAGTVHFLNRVAGWEISVMILPAIYAIYRSYRLYLGKLQDEKRHVEDMAGLHLRTIEALALAIDAKDHTTHAHLQRVRVYAMELAKDLKLSEDETEALRAASVLHDIGKLAVPEHIISKPGRLTPEEFEKMKIHPIVGAEILEQVKFPYPVVPIIRSHHEKWDGTGYPDGVKGEEIPIGARILAAVDCLDALASDRQYRRALPLDEAMAEVERQSGKSFDPRVVQALKSRYVELEQLAQQQEPDVRARLSTDVKISRGAPAAGFATESSVTDVPAPAPAPNGEAAPAAIAAETPRSRRASRRADFVSQISSARHEAQTLMEISSELGSSLSLDESLSVLAVRLRHLVPYDAIAVYIPSERVLVPRFVSGENFRLFSSLRIPVGEGLSGWVAENRSSIVNGNPSVESGYLNDPTKFSTLRSALSVPLETPKGVVGVLTLYRQEADAFNNEHLRIVQSIRWKLGVTIENALKYQTAEHSAVTDYLTGLPNARSLTVRLDEEISRCVRSGDSMAVLVCDLDGFKQINDRYSHLEGNRVLQRFAAGLREVCRGYDYVSRVGGDEFVLIMPGADRDAVNQIAERIRHVAGEAGTTVSEESMLSASVGAAFYPHDGVTGDELLAKADRVMYSRKRDHKMQSTPVPKSKRTPRRPQPDRA
jgi:diguanylate cyclase (GGDEF)-like protein/putative nucleotidyltransferase with HDIG domain